MSSQGTEVTNVPTPGPDAGTEADGPALQNTRLCKSDLAASFTCIHSDSGKRKSLWRRRVPLPSPDSTIWPGVARLEPGSTVTRWQSAPLVALGGSMDTHCHGAPCAQMSKPLLCQARSQPLRCNPCPGSFERGMQTKSRVTPEALAEVSQVQPRKPRRPPLCEFQPTTAPRKDSEHANPSSRRRPFERPLPASSLHLPSLNLHFSQ